MSMLKSAMLKGAKLPSQTSKRGSNKTPKVSPRAKNKLPTSPSVVFSNTTSTTTIKKKKGQAKSNAAAAGPSLDCIPDHALSNILGRITDARVLARCASVSRRWRKFSRQVPAVRLELRKMQAWQAEGVVSAALLERKGLKEFEVRFVCSRKYPSEGIRESRLFGCLWRLSSSIETLALFCPNTIYFKLWTWMAKFPHLHNLSVHCGRIEEHPITGCLQRLKRCEFTRTIISGPMLEDLVSFCPRLEELTITGCDPIESLSLGSSSLKSLNLVATEEYPMKSLDLQTPKLSELYVCHIDELQVEGQSLLQLGIYSTCETQVTSLQKLISLEVLGKAWALEAVEHLICSAQNLRHLVLRAYVSDQRRPMRIEHYLSPMFYLETLIMETNLLEFFCDGFTSATFDGEAPAFALKKISLKLSNETKMSFSSLLKTLLECCPQLNVVIVDSTEVEGPSTDIQKKLLELQEMARVPQCRFMLHDNPRDIEKKKEIYRILDPQAS